MKATPVEASIAIKDLSFTYTGGQAPAVSHLSLMVDRGEFVVLTGPSGSGKSTLLKALVGLIPHSYPGKMEGEVRVFGLHTREHTTAELATKVGLLFQNPENQLFSLSVEDDVAFGPENLCLSPEEIDSRVEWALTVTGMQKYRQTPPYELSGGQQQRVAIASVLAMKPSIMVFDEPTSFMDPGSAQSFVSLVRELNRSLGITVVVVEQKLEQFLGVAGRAVILVGGTVVADGKPFDVFEECLAKSLPINVPVEIRAIHMSHQATALPPNAREALRELEVGLLGRH